MLRLLPKTLSILACLGGLACDPDCEDAGRLDNTYAVYSAPLSSSVTGDNLENYPVRTDGSYHGFFNGWSVWTLKYIPSQQSFQIDIKDESREDDQPNEYEQAVATYTAGEDSCNDFTLDIKQDNFTTDETDESPGTLHEYKWTGDLAWFGDKLRGTFTYQDSWTSADSSQDGTIQVKDGEFSGSQSAPDTGF